MKGRKRAERIASAAVTTRRGERRVRWRFVVVVAMGLSLTGCTWSTGGHARLAPPARPINAGSVGTLLPNDAELSAALADTVTSTSPPTIGGAEVLPGDAATATDCLGVAAPLTKAVFAKAGVREVAFRVTSRGMLGALTLNSPWQAQSLLNTLARQWRGCAGKIVLNHGASQVFAITAVDTTDTLLSAAVMAPAREGQRGLSLDQRALAVMSNCLVDVSVSLPARRGGGPPPPNQAIGVASLMLNKVTATR